MRKHRGVTDPQNPIHKGVERAPRRKSWGPALALTVLGALILGAAAGIPWLQASREAPPPGELARKSSGRQVAPSLPPSPTPSPTTSPPPARPTKAEDAHFPAFWDVTTLEKAREVQQAVDQGHQPWRLDPALVATAFAQDLADWEVKVVDVAINGSAEEGWSASVTFRPYIGEEEHLIPGPSHTLRLIGLEGAEHPAWFVAGLESEEIVVNTPNPGDGVSSPMRVSGRGVAYEGTINAQIKDDAGNTLISADSPDRILMAGAYEPAPFSGDLRFGRPEIRSGVLILVADSGTGPTPAITIVRLRFERV